MVFLSMNTTVSIDWYLIVVVLGVIQAFILSMVLFIRSRKNGARFAYLGLLIFSLALILIEVFLNYSGLMTEAIFIYKFSLPIQFLLAPSIYFFIDLSLDTGKSRNPWIHYIPFIIILAYFSFYFLQEKAIKFNDYILAYDRNIEMLPETGNRFRDPLLIIKRIHILVFLQMLIYAGFLFNSINRKYRNTGENWFNKKHSWINHYRDLFFFYLLAIVILLMLIISYFHLGDYFFSIYLTAIIYLISINISHRTLNAYFQNRRRVKYAKSSLTEAETGNYLEKIRNVVENEAFFTGDHASLDELAKRTRLSRHIVSQVINESLGKTFFEYLAECRIERAKFLLKDPKYHNITIDEISFMVGYNSRSAFNRVFKSVTDLTPNEYRSSF